MARYDDEIAYSGPFILLISYQNFQKWRLVRRSIFLCGRLGVREAPGLDSMVGWECYSAGNRHGSAQGTWALNVFCDHLGNESCVNISQRLLVFSEL